MTSKGRFAILAAILLCLAGSASAGFAQQLRFDHIGTRQGLPSMELICLLFDSKGYLWIGTANGLARYDGFGFTVFQHNDADTSSLHDNLVFTLYEDRRGTVWVGTHDGGLHRFNPETQNFTCYRNQPGNPKSLTSNAIRSLYEDRKGRFWVGTTEGLDLMDRQTGTFTHVAVPGEKTNLKVNLKAIYEDRQGRLWLGTSKGLVQMQPDPNPLQPSFTDYFEQGTGTVVSIFEDSSGNLWAGSYLFGLNCIEKTTGMLRRYPPNPSDPTTVSHKSVTSFYEAPDKKIWMTTNGGINIYDPVTRLFSRHPHDPANPQSLSSNFNNQILADRSGVLWVATFGGGLNKYNPYTNAFNHYFSNPVDPNSLSYNNVLSFFEDRQGTFWVGTSQGLNKFDKQKASFTRYYYYGPHKVVDVNASEIHCMADAENGRLWLGTYNGLKKFHPATGIFQDCEKQFPGSDIQRFRLFNGLIAETPDKLWTILNADPFLGRFNPLTGAIIPHFKGMENGYLANTALMEKDTLWVGTSEGLFCMHTVTGEVTTYRHDPADAQSLSHTSVYSLYRDKKGVLWVGTAKGLNRVVSGKAGNRLNFRSYGTTDGLPDEQINGILEDDAGFLWISTMKGLARFDPDKQSCRNYTYLDGLQDNIFNAGAAWKNPKTGELFFGGPNGFNSFHPEKIIDDTIAPPVVFTDFKLLNKENDVAGNHISTLNEVHVRWADKAFVIRFAALNFTAPEQNQYAIMMEGFENAWRNIGNTNEATYTNLSPGRYTFRVKAANKDGVWNLRGAAITIVVLPPWWRTWWAYSLYALLLAGLFLFLRENNLRERNLQIRLNLEHAEAQRLKELNDAKSTFLTTVSHELRTPLTSIMGFSKIVQKRLAEKILPFTDLTDPKRAKTAEQVLTNLDIMVSESERLTNLINQVLDLAKIEAGKVDWHDEPVDVGDILNRAVASTSFLFEQNSIAFSQTVEPDLPRVFGDRDRLTQVVVNLLSNAAKFTPRGAVTVSAKRLDPDTLQISVADTGCGIPAKDLPFVFEKFKQAGDDTLTDKPQGTGLGLSICKEIIERHGGHIQVESTVGEGSVFSLTLPVMANQPEA